MIESSDTLEPVEQTAPEAASPEETAPEQTTEAPEPSLQERMLAQKTEAAVEPPAPEAPAYQANYKYKAFGKEKELDEFFRPLIKDQDSEKKVKEVFTRADAFDDMKTRYESASMEQQKVLQQYTALDRDVRRITKFLNSGDLDNFFSSVRLSDDMLFQHLQRKAELSKLSPMQQQAYQEGVQARAQQLIQQEQYEDLQNNYATQATTARSYALEMVMSRPEVQGAASAWDQKMGPGAFRNLVIQEGANVWHATKKDISPEDAVQLVLSKFGKLVEQAPASQMPVSPSQVPPAHAQARPQVVQAAKPVIPNINGRGTSPVKQVPKSLDDLKRMAKAMRQTEAYED